MRAVPVPGRLSCCLLDPCSPTQVVSGGTVAIKACSRRPSGEILSPTGYRLRRSRDCHS